MSIYNKLQEFYLSRFYLMIPMSIIFLTCVGSVAIYFITKDGISPFNFTMMCLCVMAAGTNLSVLLAQMQKGLIFRVLFFALCIEVLLILLYTLFIGVNVKSIHLHQVSLHGI